jgi:hypothetical protein
MVQHNTEIHKGALPHSQPKVEIEHFNTKAMIYVSPTICQNYKVYNDTNDLQALLSNSHMPSGSVSVEEGGTESRLFKHGGDLHLLRHKT